MAKIYGDFANQAILENYFQKWVAKTIRKQVKTYFKPAIEKAVDDVCSQITNSVIAYSTPKSVGIEMDIRKLKLMWEMNHPKEEGLTTK